ncbi:MAG TPA: hypothetical protein VGP72_29665 [Planctomycetota bacterium]|jgi:uncharacterized membrane protein (DUF106 family)
MDLLTQYLMPIVRACYLPLDYLLGWVTRLGPVAGLVVMAAFTGLMVNLFQKYLSNQKLMGQRNADLDTLKALTRAAKKNGDKDTLARVRGLTSRIGGAHAMASMMPALWSLPVVCLVVMWTGERLGFHPVRPGQVVEVLANFEEGARDGFAHVVPSAGLALQSPAISPIEVPKKAEQADDQKNVALAEKRIATPEQKKAKSETTEPAQTTGPQAHWFLSAAEAGTHTVVIRHGESKYEICVPVFAKGGQPPEQTTEFRTQSPTRDQLKNVMLGLTPSVEPAWWNLTLQWMGLYLVIAFTFGFGLRKVLGVQ